MCNCKECEDIREDIERASEILKTCYKTNDNYNQKLLRDIADNIYSAQDFRTCSKEQTADEMLKEIGYMREDNGYCSKHYIFYCKDDDNIMLFSEENKTFSKTDVYDTTFDFVTMQELQAINKKCKELGWMQEKVNDIGPIFVDAMKGLTNKLQNKRGAKNEKNKYRRND